MTDIILAQGTAAISHDFHTEQIRLNLCEPPVMQSVTETLQLFEFLESCDRNVPSVSDMNGMGPVIEAYRHLITLGGSHVSVSH